MFMIDRHIEQYFGHWWNRKRRKPLVLRGARQVGKSTLVRQFASHRQLVLNEINLERHLYLDTVFKTLDLRHIVQELEGLMGHSILEANSLLFLDEIQATPHAIAALRYFYEDMPDLPVIAAGSLLEFTLADHTFSMPVGRVEYLHVGPVSFSEFIGCLDPDLESWRQAACRLEKIPETSHQRLLSRLREYLFVGGMPEAVMEYAETGSLAEVQEVQRSITETYQDDFAKYARYSELARLQRVFNQIPRNIGRKIKYVNLSREERSRDVKSALELLNRAQICHKVIASHCSGVPLGADSLDHVFKVVFLDTGLVTFLCGGRWPDISHASETTLVNEGPLAEQFIGQHLAYADRGKPQLHYWLREGRADNAEIDYVIACGMRILPVDVKSGTHGSLKSMHQFVLDKKVNQAIRFDLNQASRMHVSAQARVGNAVQEIHFELLSLPLYAVEAITSSPFQSEPALPLSRSWP